MVCVCFVAVHHTLCAHEPCDGLPKGHPLLRKFLHMFSVHFFRLFVYDVVRTLAPFLSFVAGLCVQGDV